MPLPQYGIHTNVRVCSDCFNDSSRFKKDDSTSAQRGDLVSESISRLDISEDTENKIDPVHNQPALTTAECKCGMPLCICVASAPSPEPVLMQAISASSSVHSNPRPKKPDVLPKNKRLNGDSRPSHSSGSLYTSHVNYEANGEGLREAIKNSDAVAVQELLKKGVDPNYFDKQGFSLLHLAAVFNQTDIAFALIEHGAKLDSKNPQGETPLDCAPATLQYKMRAKMEEALPH